MSGESRREDAVSRLRFFGDEQAGFTIAEYIAAVAILLTVVIGAMSVIMYSSTANAATARKENALNLANQQIEMARNQPYDDLGSVWPATNPRTEGDYTIETRVSWARNASDRATSRIVRAIVSWETPRPGKVEVETRIFGRSEVANTGDVLVKVVEPDSGGTLKPLQGVLVTLTPKVGNAQKVTTDTNGTAFFGHIGSGTFKFFATKNGYVVDHSAYATDPTLVADSTTECIVTAYRSSSHRFTFVREGGGAIPSGVDVSISGSKTNPIMKKTSSGDQVIFEDLLPDNYVATVSLPTGYSVVSAPTGFSVPVGNTHGAQEITIAKNTLLNLTVTDDRGGSNRVSAAAVTLSGPTTVTGTTNSSGQLSLVVPVSGTYTITATKSGYVDGVATQAITLGTDANATVSMDRYGTLRCTYSSGSSNVTLYVYDQSKTRIAQGTTTGSGSSRRVEFPLPPATFYYVSTRSSWPSSGYSPAQSGAISSGSTTNLTVTSSN